MQFTNDIKVVRFKYVLRILDSILAKVVGFEYKRPIHPRIS